MSVTDPTGATPPADDSAANAQAAAEAGHATDTASSTESESVQTLRAQLERERARVEELTNEVQQAEQSGDTDLRDLLHQLVAAQSSQRSEVQQLRAELARSRASALPATTSRALSPEELMAQRMAEIEAHPFYCPACGRTHNYQRECVGTGASPHPAVEVVSTDELKNPPDSSDKEGVREYQSRHTAMQYTDPQVNRELLAV